MYVNENYITLETMLQMVSDTNMPMFDLSINVPCNMERFTKEGKEAYKRLIDILYGVSIITKTNVEEIVAKLDKITYE